MDNHGTSISKDSKWTPLKQEMAPHNSLSIGHPQFQWTPKFPYENDIKWRMVGKTRP